MPSTFARGDARIYVQRFIVKGIRQGMSGNQILQMLRSASVNGVSLGYRTELFYRDYNRYLNAKTPPLLTGLKAFPSGFSVDYSLPTPTRGGERYMYPILVRGTNTDTGEPTEQMMSVVSPYPIDNVLLPAAYEALSVEERYNFTPNWDQSEPQQPKQFYSELP